MDETAPLISSFPLFWGIIIEKLPERFVCVCIYKQILLLTSNVTHSIIAKLVLEIVCKLEISCKYFGCRFPVRMVRTLS